MLYLLFLSGKYIILLINLLFFKNLKTFSALFSCFSILIFNVFKPFDATKQLSEETKSPILTEVFLIKFAILFDDNAINLKSYQNDQRNILWQILLLYQYQTLMGLHPRKVDHVLSIIVRIL